MCLCAATEVAWFMLWVVRCGTKAETSVLRVPVGGIQGWQSLSMWYWMVCLLDDWDPPHEYGDTLKTVKI